MNLRRRLALLIDPSIEAVVTADPEPLRLDLYGYHSMDMARALTRIAESVDRIDRKTVKRRPRVIVCEHQDKYPEWGQS